jgi:acylglycerol lipase
MKHSDGRFKGQKGTEIYWQSWQPAGAPKAIALIVHGVGEHSGRYRHVAEALVGIGCAVYAVDHRGHGKSGGARALIERFSYAVADIDHVFELARRAHPGKPVFLIGHSMGGALSLSYTLRHPEKPGALILSGPAVALDGASAVTKAIGGLLSAIAPKAGLIKVDPSLVSRDPDTVADYAKDPLNAHDKLPARTLGEIMNFVAFLPAGLPLIKLPLLVMHGEDDKLAGVAGSRMVVANASSADKTLKVYPKLHHEIFNELPADRAVVLKDLTDWIAARLPR